MARTFVVAGHRPFHWGMWHASHTPADGSPAGPGHAAYEAFPGDQLHEGWLQGEDTDRMSRLGILAEGPKAKDAPATPPVEMERAWTPATPETAPEGFVLPDAPPAPTPEPATEPEPEPVQAVEETPTEPVAEPAPPADAPAEG